MPPAPMSPNTRIRRTLLPVAGTPRPPARSGPTRRPLNDPFSYVEVMVQTFSAAEARPRSASSPAGRDRPVATDRPLAGAINRGTLATLLREPRVRGVQVATPVRSSGELLYAPCRTARLRREELGGSSCRGVPPRSRGHESACGCPALRSAVENRQAEVDRPSSTLWPACRPPRRSGFAICGIFVRFAHTRDSHTRIRCRERDRGGRGPSTGRAARRELGTVGACGRSRWSERPGAARVHVAR